MTLRTWIGLLFSIAFGISGWAQRPADALSNLRVDTLSASDTLFFRPSSIFPNSLSAKRMAGAGELLQLHRTDSSAFLAQADKADSSKVIWQYRVFITSYDTPKFRLDSTRLLNQRPLTAQLYDDQTGISINDLRRDLGAVDYRGTFGRGLRFGNSQNLVLDSRLDLQLNGDLGEGLTVSAVVSDQNIPLQPEGNTVQLQEFDRIFVTVAKDEHALTAGDYSLQSTQGHFLRFDKNLQGLSYSYGSEQTAFSARTSLASARGQFQRIQLPVADGNQGPYRLTGSRGEPFVIVLAGTERVFLDGRLLERGLDRDYVIDYNRGEIEFTPKLLINRFQRILVEYEFVDREYLRTIISAEAEYKINNWTLYAQGFQQQDGLRRTGTQLSPAAEAALRDSPGNRQGALVPSFAVLPQGSINPIRYILIADPTGSCNQDSIWQYAPEATAPQAFTVAFTEVGQGNGNYRLARQATANGSVFEYVPPASDCTPLGDYAPVKLVQTPKALRLVSLGGKLETNEGWTASWELIGNQQDLNRYNNSTVESFAGFGSFTKAWQIGKGKFTTSASSEITGDGFEAIIPWRNAEFKRDWNLGALAINTNTDPGGEVLTNTEVAYELKNSALSYAAQRYQQADRFTGFRQNWSLHQGLGKWNLSHKGDALSATRLGTETGRTNLIGELNRTGKNARQLFGASSLRTKNYDAILDATDMVDRSVTEWYASTSRIEADSVWVTSFSYKGRQDGLKRGSTFENQDLSHQAEIGLSSPERNRNKLDLTASYRLTNTTEVEAENYYLGRLSHRYRAANSAWIRLQTTAEAGSGQERRVAIQFLQVQPGLGQYVWRDYNNDGVEDLGEFEEAVFADSASYIRTTLLTNEFVATNTLALNQTFTIDLSRYAGLKGEFWKRFSTVNTASLRRRALQSAGYGKLLSTQIADADTTIVGDDLAWRSALYLNRARNTFRTELEHRQLSTRAISIQGLQQLRTNGLSLKLLLPIKEAWRLGAELDRERRRSQSEGLDGRNFSILSSKADPSISYQPNSTIRIELIGSLREGEQIDGNARVSARGLTLQSELRFPEKSSPNKKFLSGASLRSSLERIDQTFSGVADSPSGFALLEGLRPGRSWIWNFTLDQQLGKALQLSLRYDGRQLGAGRLIHSGQAQLQAVF